MERQCRICGEWKERTKNFPKDKPKQRSLWCYGCKAEYSMIQSCSEVEEGMIQEYSGAELAKQFIEDQQKNWDYKKKFAPADRGSYERKAM